ncbi:methylated-DNA-[protein]-cysteine S-methyltransferase [Desulfohalotomaculum tongense]|uniref:methylated-DNA--[protein]-cysteine S-methyltransferase n=1 Tax=Desulforadius tongensis TaxID=1216062 RepID=UPI00195AA0C5|nr:methylated-DNA--[protein]-cysteine S-methyltransferase [Desulforadius tongensis]MBM7855331.1 methylated-DNA-[protein]-cysteine S-methyltransferase [Desulforadius tongensis]
MKYKLVPVKAGWIGVSWSDRGLKALTLPQKEPGEAAAVLAEYLKRNPKALIQDDGANKLIAELARELNNYFEGQLCSFDYLVDLDWCTPFQRMVLQSIKSIPYGETRTYKQVAEMIGHPLASRAVGGALRSNRVLLVLPCHRVIRRDGSPGGFGGQPQWKEKLLKMEKIMAVRYQINDHWL